MIRKIVMYRSNGMYTDKYDVLYNGKNGKTYWRTYTIKGEMTQKHFDFIMSHTAERIESVNGKHIADKWEKPEQSQNEEQTQEIKSPE